ncbi:MAG: ABC transporter substrate-binding protein [Alphaproteobacteria bacterium]|nr:ABC transporter substrate-binding protein [Alphaproteobacteria bacterium]
MSLALVHALERATLNALPSPRVVFDGPFVVRSWKASESVILDANPNSTFAPKIRRAFIKHVPDPSAQLLQLQQGDIDIARNLLPDQLKSAMINPAFQTTKAPRSYVTYTCMNQNNPNLAKPQVRQAIKWAIDYEGIHKNIVSTTHMPKQSFIPEGVLGSIDDAPFKRDVAKAKALLAEAGLAGGFEITLDHANTQPNADIAQAVQANLGDIGIKVTLVAGESRQVITRYRARQHQLALLSWGIDYFDPHSNAETFCINTDNSDGARNKTLAWRNSWQDADLTARAQAAVKEADGEVRAEMYVKLQRDHHARSPFALMLQSIEIAVMRKNLANFAVAPMYSRTRYDTATKA